MSARIGVITFPGSLDDVDALRAVRAVGAESVSLWHADADLHAVDAVIVPGGFSYGDYLRAGAIAAQAPVMRSVIDAARRGMPVLGICNGFQVLCEAGLLPGALMRNVGLTFRCRDQYLRVERASTVWSGRYQAGQQILIPLKHAEGRYVASERDLDALEAEGRVLFRYSAGPGAGGDSARRYDTARTGGAMAAGDIARTGGAAAAGDTARTGGAMAAGGIARTTGAMAAGDTARTTGAMAKGGDGDSPDAAADAAADATAAADSTAADATGTANPNGSLRDIAGICSADGRVAGLMPHPEHAIDALTGPSTDGLPLFASLADALGLPASERVASEPVASEVPAAVPAAPAGGR